jgi:hypothetical protein
VTASATTWLWLGVVAMGVYHGLNPAMGWPLAVANGLTARRERALFATFWPLGAGHFLAMATVLLPFVLLAWIVEWQREIRIAAGVLVLGFGLYRLVVRRHPRALARIAPSRLTAWSFLMATAHGAGLMLLPIALELCGERGSAAASLVRSAPSIAAAVAIVHTLAMIVAGLGMAWAVYRLLGLAFLRRAWLNLDLVWAASLVVAGAAALWAALR